MKIDHSRVITNPLIQYWKKSVAFQKCSLGQPPSLWLRQQVSFQSTWSLDHSEVKQLLEASSPIWLISFQIWNLSLDCIGKWREAHLKFDWIARQFPGPIWMNVHISSSYSYAMLFHLSCDLNHEFVPGINLNIRPSAWYTLINYQWTWLLDYSTVKQLLEASSPIWLIWNSSLDCIGEWTARCKSEIFIEKPLLCIAFFRAQLLRQGPDSQVKRASTRKTKTLNVLVRLTSECRNKHVYCLFPWKGENPSITMFCLICLYSCTYIFLQD